MKNKYTLISLFSGCGGLDLGFKQAGFEIVFSNDIDKKCWATYEKNIGHKLDGRSIVNIPSNEIPDADGIIGGPPCQSWSLAGAMRGIEDSRGKLFYEYIRILKDKKPKFFVAENVPGIISATHLPEFEKIIERFKDIGYDVVYKVLDAKDYGVCQERKRVIIVGFRDDLKVQFQFPKPTHGNKENLEMNIKKYITLRECIGDLPESVPAKEKNQANSPETLKFPNQEHMNGSFSTIYMSRVRKKDWDKQSFTIQAGGRHAPLHPSSANMIKVGVDKMEFEGKDPKYRRLSVRECARIQSFPDNFEFIYDYIADGYKMIGNAVPVKLAESVANRILFYLNRLDSQKSVLENKIMTSTNWREVLRPY